MTAAIYKIAPKARGASSAEDGAAAAAVGEGGAPATSLSVHSIQAGVRVITGHARLACAAAAGGNPAREYALLKQQGEILMLAALRLLDEVSR